MYQASATSLRVTERCGPTTWPFSNRAVLTAHCMRWAPMVMKRGINALQALEIAPLVITILREA